MRLTIDNSIPHSLMHAKYIVFNELCRSSDLMFIFGNAVYRTPHDWRYEKCMIRLGFWKNTKVRHTTLMKVGSDGQAKFIKFNLGQFDEDNPTALNISLEHMTRPLFCAIFDEICRISDEGYSIVYYESQTIYPRTKTKTLHTFLPPMQGSILQIKADMLSPDFAYMDKKIDSLPF